MKIIIRDTSILSGKWLWVWQVSGYPGGIPAIIKDAKSLEARGIKVKAADGSNVWSQYAQMVQPCKDAGLQLQAWTYCYGNDPVGEAKSAYAALQAGGIGVCLDVEMEYTGKRDAAITMGQTLRKLAPDALITFAPWCMPKSGSWANVPYDEFAEFCDAVEPQNYWSDYEPTCDVGLKQSDLQLKSYGLPIYPIGQAYAGDHYTPVTSDYTLFEKTCHDLGYTGVSFWRMGCMSDSMKAAITKMNFPVVQPPTQVQSLPFTKDEGQKVIDDLGALYAASGIPGIQAAAHFAADALRDVLGIPKQQ